MKTSFKHYWGDILKNFIIYSLVPLLFIILIGYPLVYQSFLHTLYKQNKESNENLAQKLETALMQCGQSVGILADTDILKGTVRGLNAVPNAEVYKEIYRQLNKCSLRPECYLLNDQGGIVLSTVDWVPDYLAGVSFTEFGQGQRMLARPDKVSVERCITNNGKERHMCIGQAVQENGQIIGYVLFCLPEEVLSGALLVDNVSVTNVVTDRFGYLYVGYLNESFVDYGKLKKALRDGAGKVAIEERNQYVTSRAIIDGQVVVYTLTDIGYLDTMFVRIGLLLIAASVLFSGILVTVSQRFARRKSKVLDDMVSALRDVQEGDLTKQLAVDTGDEFQLFAEAYNRMLSELDKQMEMNKEIGSRTVISELKQLESQFNPHFLFNTLENVKYMIDIAPSTAKKMIVTISEILRYCIRNTQSQSRLDEDWRYAESYLSILKYRFGNNLTWDADIAPEALSCMVPKLVFQPVIENAVTYGFGSRMSLHIDVSVTLKDGLLTMSLHNDGDVIAPEKLKELRAFLKEWHHTTRHIGLYNIHRRIQLLYGMSYGVTIDSTREEGTVVLICFPVQKGEQHD